MARSALGGIGLAIAGILLGQVLEGGHIGSLIQTTAFFIVMSGTVGAVLLQAGATNFIAGVRLARNVFFLQADDKKQLAKRINLWSQISRNEGLLQLESHMNRESEPFIRKGLRLLIDGTPVLKLQEICSADLHFYEVQQRNAIKIWDAAGGYAPTIGILGAVLGLIHVMENLADPTKLGSGIAVAFVATIYGVSFANLIFLPIANRLKVQLQQELMRREELLTAWVSMANGDHPRIIEERLLSYVSYSKS